MKRIGTVLLAVAGLAASATVYAGPANAAAIHDMRGHFAAFTLGTIDNPDMRPGTIDISTQLGPIVAGRASLAGRAVTVAGTISPSDDVDLVGLGGPDTVTVRGTAVHPGDMQPCIFEGSYQVRSLGAGADAGDVVAVHQVPVTGAPSISGRWTGEIADPDIGGRLTASFTQSATGALTGRIDAVLFNPPPDPPGFQFTIDGQAAWDGRVATYLVIGGADGALATLQLRPARAGDGSPLLGGTLRLLRADGTAQNASIELRPEG